MEEVDSILMRQLRDIGCDIDDEIRDIRELEAHQILHSVCLCLALINADNQNMVELSRKCVNRSLNMSLKYNIASQLADECKRLGFKGDIGYQTFLYGAETDVRKLLLFLLEALPKEEITSFDRDVEHNLLREISKLQLNTCWTPPIVRRKPIQFNAFPKSMSVFNSLSVKTILTNKMAPNKRKFCDLIVKTPRNLMAIMEWNCCRLDSRESSRLNRFKHISIQSIISNSIQIDSSKAQRANSLTIKPIIAIKPNYNISYNDSKELNNSDSDVLSNECKDEKVDIIQVLQQEWNECQQQFDKFNSIKEEAVNCERVFKKEYSLYRELEMSDKTKSQIVDQLNEVKNDIETISIQWQAIESQLLDQLTQLKIESKARNERSAALHKNLNDLKKSVTAKVKEIKSKEMIVDELKARLPQQWPPSRTSYTKRILEIIANIKKQNNETKKVLIETRIIQKEINVLSGKLSRTFTVADEEIFKEAKTNEWNRKCYKLLASLHDYCDQLLDGVASIGSILREIRQLEEAVESERSRKTSSNLARILADLSQIKLENEQLNAKLNSK